jgi:osmotically-inducible protein OsmY
MRNLLVVLSLLMLGGCTALVVGGAGGGGYQAGKDERPAGVVASDAAITRQINAKYAADSMISAFSISVRTHQGRVTLSGTVGSYAARDQAVDLAKSTAGVMTVTNQINIED